MLPTTGNSTSSVSAKYCLQYLLPALLTSSLSRCRKAFLYHGARARFITLDNFIEVLAFAGPLRRCRIRLPAQSGSTRRDAGRPAITSRYSWCCSGANCATRSDAPAAPLDQILERAPPVEPPNDERLASAEVIEGVPEDRAVTRAAEGLLEDTFEPCAPSSSRSRSSVCSSAETPGAGDQQERLS